MKTIALLTTLALSASAAFAGPYDRPDTDRDRRGDRVDERDRYDRYDNSRSHRDYRGRWRPLAQRYSGATNRQFINLRGQGGRLDRLRIESERGSPLIQQIAIEYLDRSVQKVRLDTRLPRGSGEVIRLNGDQRIQRIIVYTDAGAGGSYSVYGA